MKFSGVLFVIAVSVAFARGTSRKTLVFPTQTNTSYVVMDAKTNLNLKAFTLCMRAATELVGRREVSLFSFRSVDHDELSVWREKDGSLSLYLQSSSEHVRFDVPELNSLMSHVCVTWDSITGATSFFVDGNKSLTKIYKRAFTVQAEGQALLGQDADSFLGDFDACQSFVGSLSDVDMWDSVLSDSAIQKEYSRQGDVKANVYNWETAQLIVNGNTHVINMEV
ncbi:pentraxin fusion protein-like [Xyrichtys novacula]|uniref:Pentraxin family member n=1 Tax=Xyrichtys novacula TaxID=13765 RepID=A0AAV1GPQ3_XYRNO|nr:pentraxin fusion protein-like [Xyrichtys novacula]